MDAVLVVGSVNAAVWGLSSLVRPLTGFPLAGLVLGLLLACNVLPFCSSREVSLRHVLALGVTVDGLQYLVHRFLCHRLRPLSASHAVHHAHRHPRPDVAFATGPADALVQLLVPVVCAAWCVQPSRGSLVLFGAAYSVWLQWIHDAALSSSSLFSSSFSLLVTPRFHASHHADPTCNFGHLLTVWDWLGGTSKWGESSSSISRLPFYASHPVVRKALEPLSRGIPSDCLGIDGRLYRADEALLRGHPGGAAWLALTAGTDVSLLFETMHVDAAKARALLARVDPVGSYARDPSSVPDLATHRRLLREVVLPRFPTRASRGPTRGLSWRFAVWACVCLGVHGLLLCKGGGVDGGGNEMSPSFLVVLLRTVALAALSGGVNAVLGGMGHNFLHRLDPRALALDWNGLSTAEWILEHVASHHPRPNTPHDHDAIAMAPFVHWDRACWRNRLLLYPVFAIGEGVVAVQGCFFGHRCRWKVWRAASSSSLPAWLRLAPVLFLARVLSHVWVQGVGWGLASLLVSTCVASFYFSLLAHWNHAPRGPPSSDWVVQQLGETRDLRAPAWRKDWVLGLDRQTLHHLFPSLDHSRLDAHLRAAVASALPRAEEREALVPRSARELHSEMCRRLWCDHSRWKKEDGE